MAADLKDLAANKPNAHELEPLKKVAASMAKYFGPHTALHIPVFKYQNTPYQFSRFAFFALIRG
jgi:hypothetical protein